MTGCFSSYRGIIPVLLGFDLRNGFFYRGKNFPVFESYDKIILCNQSDCAYAPPDGTANFAVHNCCPPTPLASAKLNLIVRVGHHDGDPVILEIYIPSTNGSTSVRLFFCSEFPKNLLVHILFILAEYRFNQTQIITMPLRTSL